MSPYLSSVLFPDRYFYLCMQVMAFRMTLILQVVNYQWLPLFRQNLLHVETERAWASITLWFLSRLGAPLLALRVPKVALTVGKNKQKL